MANYDVSFSFQRYYQVLEKLIDNNAQIVIFRAWDISPGDLGHIQDDTWLTTNQICAYGYDGVLYDIDTDEEVGDYSKSSIGFENREYFRQSISLDNYTGVWASDDEEAIVATVDWTDENIAKVIGFQGDATPAIINNVINELQNGEILFVFDDDGDLQNRKSIIDIIDLKNDRDYYDVENDRDANRYTDIEWVGRDHTIIDTHTGRTINIDNVNQAQYDDDVVAVLDKEHAYVRDNGRQPIEKLTVNMYQSAWDYITNGAVMKLEDLEPRILANNNASENPAVPVVAFRNNYLKKDLYYMDTTEQENPWIELDNSSWYYYWDDFDKYAELNIIPDPEPPQPEPGTDPEKAYKKMKELGEGYLFFDEDTANISYILDTMKHDLYDGNGDLVGTDAKLFKK